MQNFNIVGLKGENIGTYKAFGMWTGKVIVRTEARWLGRLEFA